MQIVAIASPRIITVTPQHLLDPDIAIAASRAGSIAILDLGYNCQPALLAPVLDRLASFCGSSAHWGVRWDSLGLESRGVDCLAEILSCPVSIVVLAGCEGVDLNAVRGKIGCRQIFVEVRDLQEAEGAIAAGCDGLIVKGHESAGSVSRYSSFVLLQELSGRLTVPYWVQGGIGTRSAAAVVVAGAAGVVLCEQLWLADESALARSKNPGMWSQLDGSETVLLGPEETPFRLFARSGRAKFRELEERVLLKQPTKEALLEYLATVDDPLLPVGQDVAFAGPLAKRYGSVGCILRAYQASMDSAIEIARAQEALAPGSALARAHGTLYPIVQGPMTRVSDTAGFARAVADGGGLPVFALSVMRRPQVDALLTEAKELLGDLPWGIGLLGFMPLKLRQEQLKVVYEAKPSFAIIAGGRPSQARELEELSISTYLHVPSPGLLRQFIKEGARKFVFEGSECGGHTGPRTSFVLWESAIEILDTAEIKDPESVQILFAGGIHDELSAAMLSVLASPLVSRGMKVGVIMGTAYLFTREAVSTGAIVEEYQAQALSCSETTLLQSGVGIYTRCAKTDFCHEFNRTRRELLLAKETDERTLEQLELLNIGRLRIASKGIAHNARADLEDNSDRYQQVDVATQRREGMYMLGDVARLRNDTVTIAELHETVSAGSQELLAHAAERWRLNRPARRPAREDDKDIAIIGMSCVMPKAENLRSFWQNIIRKIDAFEEVSEERWRPADFFDPKRGTPDKVYTTSGSFLDDIQFDPMVYGIPPASLRSIEPVQLLALHVARQALQDAGLDRHPFHRERTACIFAAGGMNDLGTFYIFRTLLSQFLPKVPGLAKADQELIIRSLYDHELPAWTEDSFPGILMNVVAGRVANRLDLGGTNCTVDAACAASLAALDVGIKQLRSHDADVALIGGVDATNGSVGFMSFAQTHALSPRGRCRPFDDRADGTAIGEGVAALVLKRLPDAERDGDRIYAVIKGIGSSSDGRNRSLTAPHPQGQLRALHRAYEDAEVAPTTIGLIEAHGTGTAVGDKSEIESLVAAFADGDAAAQSCAVGSVKSMVGHTKIAAGLAGVIKAALALKHRVLPPTIGVEVPNSRVNFAETPFYINTETRPWLSRGQGHPRRSGVSAFGFGGTNFHAVLEEYTDEYRETHAIDLNPRDAEPFVFFGRERAEVEQALERLLSSIDHPEQLDLAQLAYSWNLQLERAKADEEPCVYRLALVASSAADLKQKLEVALREVRQTGRTEFRHPLGLYYREGKVHWPVCVLFPGQGSQKINMLRDLVTSLPMLHDLFARADRLLGGRFPQPLSSLIFPVPVFSDEERQEQQAALNATQIAQPALGVVDLAALEVLKAYGVQPDFVAGHSYGEYVALCAAGVIEPDDLIRLSETRGRISATASQESPGALAAVDADGPKTEALIARHRLDVSIANLNAPDQTIIGGTTEAIEAAAVALRGESLRVTRVAVTAAFHTPAMAAARDLLAAELDSVAFQEPRIPVFSNTTGACYPTSAAAIGSLLARQIVEPVRFAEEVEKLYEAGARIFIEAGPGLTLSGLVDRILGERPHIAFGIDAPGRPGWLQLAHLIAQLFALGVPVQVQTWFKGRQLRQLSVDDVVAEARAKANPGPLIWRVNGNRAMPWHSAPAAPKVAAPSRKQPDAPAFSSPTPVSDPALRAKATSASLVPGRRPGSPVPRVATTSMRYTMDNSSSRTDQATAPPSQQSYPAFGIAQDSFGQLIELQREQQLTLRAYMDFLQANFSTVQALSGNSGLAAGGRAGSPAPHAPAYSAAPSEAHWGGILASVPPAPVLPAQIRPAAPVAEHLSPAVLEASVERPAEAPNPGGKGTSPGTALANVKEGSLPALPSVELFKSNLLGAVSQRTGYPEDVLDLDAHLEADLGVDSIKRIEIFSSLKDFSALKNLMEGGDEEKLLEQLSALKTIREIIAWYQQLSDAGPAEESKANSPKKASTPPLLSPVETAESQTAQPAIEHPDRVRCYALKPVPADVDEVEPFVTESGRPILVLGPASEESEHFIQALVAHGYLPWLLSPGPVTQSTDHQLRVDFSSPGVVDELRALVRGVGQPVGSLVSLLGMFPPDESNAALDAARCLFLTLKALAPDFEEQSDPWLINLTRLDGQFGLTGSSVFPVEGAGTLGVAKSAAREWPHLRVRCIDLAPDLDLLEWIAQVIQEMHHPDSPLEIGLTSQGRWRLELQPEVSNEAPVPDLGLEDGSVLLITGGAYGITAEVAKALASGARHLRLALVGRSERPKPETECTRNIAGTAELRQSLLSERRAQNDKVKPAEIETDLKRILKEREIRRNLAVLEQGGHEVSYHSLDVRDHDAFGQLIDDIYQRWGRIDGVIHGAGIVNDKLIRDKSLESFDAVYLTKVNSALTLARKLRPDSLKFIVFFSSVAGRFGNSGQCDYSAANEVLNKLSGRLRVEWPNVHVASLNWGPWEGGMVSKELIRLFALRDIKPIPMGIGVRECLNVLARPVCGPELVLTASLPQIAGGGHAQRKEHVRQSPRSNTPQSQQAVA